MHLRFAATILLMSLAWIPSADAQVQELWTRTYDGSAQRYDLGAAIVVDGANNVYVTGRSQAPAGNFIMATVAYDAAGQQRWSHDYVSPLGGDDFATSISLSPQGDVYVAGWSQVVMLSTFVSRQTLIKYSAAGVLSWAHQYGTPSTILDNRAWAMVIDAQGNVILGGGVPGADTDFCVRKIDPAGNLVWTVARDGSAHGADSIIALTLAPNGDVLAVGTAYQPGGVDANIAVLRVDANGTLLWEREIDSGLSDTDRASDVAVDAAGNAYVVGTFDVSPSGDSSNQAIVALDPLGTTLWSRNIDGGANLPDGFTRVRVDPFGRIVAAGYVSTASDNDASVTVFDPNGGVVWTRTFDGPVHLDDAWGALEIDSLGNINVAGSSRLDAGAMSYDRAVALGYDPMGQVRYVDSGPTGMGFFSADYVALAVAPDGSINCAGYGDQGAFLPTDYLVTRLDRTSEPYCFGDGSGSACPCGNASTPIEQSGCASSFGIGGRLIDSGASSLSADTFVLNGTNMSSSACLYFQGTSAVAVGAGAVFGDGLRCAGGTVVRLSTKQNVSGQSQYPESGDAAVSVRGGITSPGQRTYQVWFRNAAPFCTSSTFNLTNGLRVTWIP